MPSDPKPSHHTPARLMKSYQAGIYLKVELVAALITNLTAETVESLPECCPPEIIGEIRKRAADLPADDDDAGWGELISLNGGSPFPWVTMEEIEERNRRLSSSFREGIRLFRQWTAQQ